MEKIVSSRFEWSRYLLFFFRLLLLSSYIVNRVVVSVYTMLLYCYITIHSLLAPFGMTVSVRYSIPFNCKYKVTQKGVVYVS